MGNPSRLVVVPSDPISAYEAKGLDWLERYYNPMGFFNEVFAVSPYEKGRREAYGMTILGVPEWNFARTIRDLAPGVVRAYGGYGAADVACRSRVAGIPVVVSIHDTNPKLLYRAVHYADLVICMSKVVRRAVVKFGVPEERTRLLPNRIDPTIFRPIHDPSVLCAVADNFQPGKYLLHIGRKSFEKNLDGVLCAMAILPEEYRIVIVGQGDRQPYETQAQHLGIAERCHWIDSIRNSDLPAWYSWCDCLCVPSRWEGFGLVFIEAAACGAPIVTSDLPPMNEYLDHGTSAHLVKDYESPEALASAVRTVCENSTYRNRLSIGAVAAASPFHRAEIDSREVDIYREALNLTPDELVPLSDVVPLKIRWAVSAAVRRPQRIIPILGHKIRSAFNT